VFRVAVISLKEPKSIQVCGKICDYKTHILITSTSPTKPTPLKSLGRTDLSPFLTAGDETENNHVYLVSQICARTLFFSAHTFISPSPCPLAHSFTLGTLIPTFPCLDAGLKSPSRNTKPFTLNCPRDSHQLFAP